MVLTSKTDSYYHYSRGAFGNKLRTWATYEELINSDYKGVLCIRYNEPGSRFCRYDVPISEVGDRVKELIREGAVFEKMVYSEMAPDSHLTIQGEFMRSIQYIDMLYSNEQVPMRRTKEWKWITGVSALELIRSNFSPSSYEDLQALMDVYPDSIYEFSAYSCDVGSIPGRNVVIWEVRNY